jgi:hypothetical protein
LANSVRAASRSKTTALALPSDFTLAKSAMPVRVKVCASPRAATRSVSPTA